MRGDHASFRDAVAAFRDYAGPAILLGVASVAAGGVLGTNALVGLSQGEPVGWFIATLAVWGLVVSWCGAIVAWPLVVDPRSGRLPVARPPSPGGSLLLAHPGRFAALGIVIALIVVVSAILLAAILTISISFIALVACRYVYPTADRLEARLVEGA